MNNTQRKYLRDRIESTYKNKMLALQNEVKKVPPAYSSEKEKISEVQQLLSGVGIELKSHAIAYYVTTEKDKAFAERTKTAEERLAVVTKQLKQVKDRTVDAVMLGNDADALLPLLAELEAFPVEDMGIAG